MLRDKVKDKFKKTKVGIVVKKAMQKRNKIKKRAIRWAKCKILYPLWYKICARKPIKEDKVVFIEHRYEKMSNNYHILYDELVSKYTFAVSVHFLREGFIGGIESIARCFYMIRDISTAKYVFVNEGTTTIGCLPLRDETIIMNTWHGCGAFKKFGFSTADLIFGDTRQGMIKYPTYKNCRYVTVSSPEIVWAFKEAMGITDDSTIMPIGLSRTDVFYNNEYIQKAFARLYQIIPQAKGKKIIVYAPTFRGRVASAKAPNMLNVAMFEQALHNDYILLIKHHPVVKKLPRISGLFNNFAFDVTKTMSIEELLCVADICISDYSSLIYEYSLFGKPMLFFAFDLDEYFDWRGFYYNYDELTPGPVCKTNREMIEYIQYIEERFDPSIVQRFRQKFMSSCDGHATERILELMFGEELKKRKKAQVQLAQYHLTPNAIWNFDIVRKERSILKQKKRISGVYEKSCKRAVDQGKVILVQVTDEISEQFLRLKKLICDQPKFHVLTMRISSRNAVRCIRELATAAYIFLESDNIWVDMIAVREETQIIYLPQDPVFVERRYYNSIEMMGQMGSERQQRAPLFSNGGTVLVPVDADIQAWKRCLGLHNKFAFLRVGNYNATILIDWQYQKAAKNKLEELVPETVDKQIILYAPTKRKNVAVNQNRYLNYSLLYEYLPENHIVLCYYNDIKMPGISKYYRNKIVNCSKLMHFEELVAVANIIVGDYQPILFECAKAGRKLFRHTPDEQYYLGNEQIDAAILESFPGEKIEDTMDFLNKLKEDGNMMPKTCDMTASKMSEQNICETALKQLLLKRNLS